MAELRLEFEEERRQGPPVEAVGSRRGPEIDLVEMLLLKKVLVPTEVGNRYGPFQSVPLVISRPPNVHGERATLRVTCGPSGAAVVAFATAVTRETVRLTRVLGRPSRAEDFIWIEPEAIICLFS